MNRLDSANLSGRISVNKTDYYLVENYQDNEKCNRYIDSFANKNKPTNYNNYSNYAMVLYKESEETNLKGAPGESSIIDKYTSQDDLLCEYEWYKGKYMAKSKFKDGKYVLQPGDEKVIIEDIKK